MGDYRVKKIRNGARSMISRGTGLALQFLSPWSAEANAIIQYAATNAADQAVYAGLRQYGLKQGPVLWGLTARQLHEMYLTASCFLKLVGMGAATGLTAAVLAKPLTGETAEEFEERFIKEYVGDPRRMMEVLSFFNLLRELPPKGSEELIKANRLATVLEGTRTAHRRSH
jgi:hypothetical protein